MTKYFIGAVGSLLGALAGVWLMVAPFALAYQPEGADWADPTFTDFWTGLPLLVVSLVGFVAFVLALVEELRERGIVERRVPASQLQQPQGQPQGAGAPAGDAPNDPRGDMDRVLLPLVTAMLEDMRDRGRTVEDPERNAQVRPDTAEYERRAQR